MVTAGTIGIAGCTGGGGDSGSESGGEDTDGGGGTGDGGGNTGDGGGGTSDGGGDTGDGGGDGDSGGESWPQLRYDAANTGSTTQASGPSSGSLSKAWAYTGASPSSAGNTVLGEGLVVTVTEDKRVVAIDEGSGSKQWEFDQLEYSPGAGALAVGDGTVYVDGPKLYALDASSGTKQWSADTNGDIKVKDRIYTLTDAINPGDGSTVWTTPDSVVISAIGDGVAYGIQTKGRRGADTIVAMDAESGDKMWEAPFEPLMEDPTAEISTLTVGNGSVFSLAGGGGEATLYALNVSNGDQQWSRQLFDDANQKMLSNAVTLANGTLLFASQGRLRAHSASDGAEQWTYQDAVSNVLHVDGTLFASSGKGIHALNLADGSLMWKYEGISGNYGLYASNTIYANGAVYTAQRESLVMKLAPS